MWGSCEENPQQSTERNMAGPNSVRSHGDVSVGPAAGPGSAQSTVRCLTRASRTSAVISDLLSLPALPPPEAQPFLLIHCKFSHSGATQRKASAVNNARVRHALAEMRTVVRARVYVAHNQSENADVRAGWEKWFHNLVIAGVNYTFCPLLPLYIRLFLASVLWPDVCHSAIVPTASSRFLPSAGVWSNGNGTFLLALSFHFFLHIPTQPFSPVSFLSVTVSC